MKPLIWGQRVRVHDKSLPCHGRVGQYEGVISIDLGALRVRFDGGVVPLKREQLRPLPEHPVCIARRLKAVGQRPPRPVFRAPPECYSKDYGKTSAEIAVDAWLDAPDDANDEELSRLLAEALRAHRYSTTLSWRKCRPKAPKEPHG